MRAQLAILVLVRAVSTTSAGQLMDENTRELTRSVSVFVHSNQSEVAMAPRHLTRFFRTIVTCLMLNRAAMLHRLNINA
jgi:hypothetical protein